MSCQNWFRCTSYYQPFCCTFLFLTYIVPKNTYDRPYIFHKFGNGEERNWTSIVYHMGTDLQSAATPPIVAASPELEHQESNPGLSGYKPEALPLSYVPKLHMSAPWRFRWYASTCQPLRWRRTETIAPRHHTFDTIACCDSFVQGMMKSTGNYRSKTQNPPSRAMAL